MDEGNQSSQLDPELWQGLPPEILDSVIAKLPFSIAVAFRTVCKKWYSDIIPRATVHLEASTRSSLLYFCSHIKGFQGSALWLQVCNANGESAQEFQSKSFPEPSIGEFVQLLVCERGLLFFGFICKESNKMRDIVVCNPLLSVSKCLGLPRSLQCGTTGWRIWRVFVGVTFGYETGRYFLAIAGLDETWRHVTFLYDSLTSAWTAGSLLPALREVADGVVRKAEDGIPAVSMFGTGRLSFCYNGNLYWLVKIVWQNCLCEEYFLKFDSYHGTWSFIPNLLAYCLDIIFESSFSAATKGGILMWHLHWAPLLCRDGPPELLSYEEVVDPIVRPPQYIGWPCRSDPNVNLTPEIKLMPLFMLKKIYNFLYKLESFGSGSGIEYDAFSQRDFIYHVAVVPVYGLVVLVQDTNENSFTELPNVPHERFPAAHNCSPENVWSFSASLSTLP